MRPFRATVRLRHGDGQPRGRGLLQLAGEAADGCDLHALHRVGDDVVDGVAGAVPAIGAGKGCPVVLPQVEQDTVFLHGVRRIVVPQAGQPQGTGGQHQRCGDAQQSSFHDTASVSTVVVLVKSRLPMKDCIRVQ